MSEQLPKQVFCRREPDGEGATYLGVVESADGFAVVGEVIMAGRYELVEMVQITTEPAVVTVEKTE